MSGMVNLDPNFALMQQMKKQPNFDLMQKEPNFDLMQMGGPRKKAKKKRTRSVRKTQLPIWQEVRRNVLVPK